MIDLNFLKTSVFKNLRDGKLIRHSNSIQHIITLPQWRAEEFQSDLQDSLNVSGSSKSADRSWNLRLNGNKLFKQKLYLKALRMYSKAVLYASDPQGESSTQLSLAYANRSAALYFLQHWKHVIEDVDHAIEHGYPAELRYKLLIRKGESLKNVRRKEDAIEALECASQSLKKSNLSSTEVKAKQERISQLLVSCHQLHDGQPHACNNGKDDEDVQMRLNPKLQNAAIQVTLGHSVEKGRYLLANADINPGDILIRERAFAAVLLNADHEVTHCHYCCTRTLSLITCHHCPHVQYCSKVCRDTAWQKHHWIECSMWNILNQVGTFSHLGLRIVLNANILSNSSITAFLDTMPLSTTQIAGCSADGHYRADYPAMYSLQTHTDLQAMEDVWEAHLNGFLMSMCIYLIQHKSEVTDWESLLADPEVCSLATLISHHTLQMRCNIHAITSVQTKDDSSVDCSRSNIVETMEQVRIASAVYPTTSLMNHGCDPNVIASFHDDEITIRATKQIAEGEEICHCYGPHVNHMSPTERQVLLKEQYYFNCQCAACISSDNKACDWSWAFKCSECSQPATLSDGDLECTDGSCAHRGDASRSVKLKEKANQLLEEGTILMDSGYYQKCLECLHQSLDILEEVLYKHHRAISEVQDSLARCYAETGDLLRSAEHLEKAIIIVKKVYGDCSIEVAQELHKLAQVLFNGRQVARAKPVITEALHLLSGYYGDSHETVQELLEMQTCLMVL